MARARRPGRGQRSAYRRLLAEMKDIGRRLQRGSRDATVVRTAFSRTLERLVVEARRGGHRVSVDLHGGRRQSIPGEQGPEALLAVLGVGDRRGGRGGRQNAVFVPDPGFCAALGCAPVYPKGTKICVTVGCTIGVGVLTCVSICFDFANGGPATTMTP
jgi:hypothetical protein